MGSVESYESKSGRRYRVRYRRPDNKQTDKRGFRTKREAENFLASVETSKLRGEWVDPSRSRVRFSEIAEAWYASKIRVKPTTRSGYRNSLHKHVLPEWGDVRIVDIDHAHVQSWVAPPIDDAVGVLDAADLPRCVGCARVRGPRRATRPQRCGGHRAPEALEGGASLPEPHAGA